MSSQQKPAFTSILPMILGLTLSVGVIIGYVIGDKSFSDDDVKKSSQKFGEIIDHINKNYVDEIDVQQLSEDTYDKLLDALDPHTRYIPLKNQKEEQAALEKDFGGIGIEFNMVNDTIFVLNVIPNGPAYTSGMLSGDRIITVNGETIAGIGITHSGIFEKLKGSIGEDVKVGIYRRNTNEIIELTMTRKRIQQRSLNISYMLDKKTGYVKLSKFSRDASVLFSDAINSLEERGMQSLIVDLRGNTGGYLNEATDIVDQFLPKGKTIVYTMGRDSSDKKYYYSEIQGSFEKGAVILLIDQNSASASEILAGALQDNDRAFIVGRRSYGKGLVQTPIELSDGSGLTLTTSRYYTPSGRCIQKPYGEGQDYFLEHLKRYESGELFNADSIKNNDSLKYQTLRLKRTVYGGGGISPDIFVPDDTSYRTPYFNRLFNDNALIEFAIYHAQDHYKLIHDMGLTQFKNDYVITDRIVTDLASFAEQRGIKVNQEELWKSKPVIINYIKAYIAREIWDNLGFYQVMHKRDPYITKAQSALNQAEKLLQD